MFRMYIKLNDNQMNKDGVGTRTKELTELILGIESYKIDSIKIDSDGNTEHLISTTKFGDESYLISLLEEIPWFMKYVLTWHTNDNGLESDMIDVEREMGLQCSYAV